MGRNLNDASKSHPSGQNMTDDVGSEPFGRDLANACVIVTGATGELGRRIAERLAKEGSRLVLTGRRDDAFPDIDDAVIVPGDLRQPGFPRKLVAIAIREFGRLDGLVNAAGVVAFGRLRRLDDDTLDELLLTNVIGPIRLLRDATDALVESEGFAVNITGVVAERAMPAMAAYSASKAALSSFSDAAWKEFRREGVTVIDVRPPHTETGLASRPIAGQPREMPEGLDPDAVADRVIEAILAGERFVASRDFADETDR